MTDSILQSFLNNRFITTDDPEHIESLTTVSAVVQRLLRRERTKVISYTLVALDPTVSVDEPVVVEMETLLIKHWPTFRNSVAKTKDTPIAYIQAVVLDALYKLSNDETFAAIIWHTGCNVINYYKLAGQEEVFSRFLLEIGKRVEEHARYTWIILESAEMATIDPSEFALPEVSPVRISEEEVIGHLKAASIHTSWGEGGESTFTASQGNVSWPKFFSERAGKGLAAEINAALSTQNESLVSISNHIHEAVGAYLASYETYLELIASTILSSSQSVNRRSHLLWWKQALYSPRLGSGYRALSPLTQTIAMAVDLADNVSPIHPRSVDFFLKETLRDIQGDETDKGVAVADLLKSLQQLSDTERQLLEELGNENEGRKSLGACMAAVMQERMIADEVCERSGLDEKARISKGELAVWLFHDLQASALARVK